MNDKPELRCKKIIVTGGGSGIGFAIAKRFVRGGAWVVITGRNKEKLERACVKIASDNLFHLQMDVRNIAEQSGKIDEAVALLTSMGDGLQSGLGLVNSAGLASKNGGYRGFNASESEWDDLMDTNLKATFFLMRNVANYAITAKVKCNILNISSAAYRNSTIGAYTASKLSLSNITRGYGCYLAPFGVILNGIEPGIVRTPMSKMLPGITDGISEGNRLDGVGIGRAIRADEIAELAFYMMSNFGEILAGSVVLADGGWTKR
ncbi:3-oxoacyl-ACP reductase [Clostridia bacterium]|nr:3-oxoacyl-ACP reductase [Clostridia bacterium]